MQSMGPPAVIAMLRADIRRSYAYLQGSRWQKIFGCIASPGVQAVVVYRFGQWARLRPKLLRCVLDPVYWISSTLIRIAWGIELPRGAKIGPGLYIGHFGGITVSAGTVIGRDCNLSQAVTIGVAGEGAQRGVPTIGDQVYIAPGARIIGKITVGNNVKIGANAVIYKDVPDNAIAVLDPGFRILSYDGNRRDRRVIDAGAARERRRSASTG
jgi:serine O-acetyltransferase